MENSEKIKKLEMELEKYKRKLREMEIDWAATKAGSAYGNEYLEVQCKVYMDMIIQVKEEILKLKKN
jgi:hypothetical protein